MLKITTDGRKAALDMRDVTIMSAGHKIKVPSWRGKLNQVDAFVVGATAGE